MSDKENKIVQTGMELISIESINTKQDKLKESIDYVIDYFSGRNLHINRFESGGIPSVFISPRAIKNPTVLLNGHMDVVPGNPEQFEPILKNGHLVGRGAVDMKLFNAVAMQIMADLLDIDPTFDIGIYFSADEELGGQNGAKVFIENGYCPQLLINGDGGTEYNIILGSKGLLNTTISVNTNPGRNSYPWEGQNSAEILLDAYQKLQSLFPGSRNATAEDNWQSTYSISQIRTENELHGPAQKAEMDIRINFIEDKTVESLTKKIETLIAPVNIKVHSFAERLFIPEDRAYINQFLKIAEKHFRNRWGRMRDNGSSDAKFFDVNKTDVVLIKMPGFGSHTTDEQAKISGVEPMYKTLMEFVIDYMGKENES